ncbi:MAG: hypothetical protein WD688_08690 [Candidatus Binatia bacterium]
MAHMLYKDKLIIASAELNDDSHAWKVRVDISWNLVTDRQFSHKAEAEQFGCEIAKDWIDKHSPEGTKGN